MKKLFAEFAGTFILVFLGTGAVVFDGMFAGAISHLGVGLVFGLAVMLIIYAIGDISGAHINPAVSIAFFVTGKSRFSDTWSYIFVQLLGAAAASFVLSLYAPAGSNLGATLPAPGLSVFKAFLMEFVLTFLLMYIVVNVSTGAKEKGITAGIAVGALIAVEAIVAGPLTGASMNPARSLGPAIISGNYQYLWIYIFAPVTGAAAGALASAKGR